MDNSAVIFITMSLNLAAAFIFGCTGETITEKSGHLNMGIPGIMSLGMCGSVVGLDLYLSCVGGINNVNGFMSILMVLLFTLLFSAVGGLLFSFFAVTLRCNQNVTGLTLTTLGAGLNQFIVSNLVDEVKASAFTTVSKNYFQFIFGESFAKTNGLTLILFNHGFLFYLAIILAVVATLVLKKTRIGLNLRACGENPACADATGINVGLYRYMATIVGSCVAGLGGAFLFLCHYNGALEYNVTSFGWLAVALVIFTLWNPSLGILGSFIFSMLYYAPTYFNFGTYVKLATALPYLFTIIVLIITSIIDKKNSQAPAGLGISYFREDR